MLLEQKEAALVVEDQGIENDTTTLGEIASDFIIVPRDETRLDIGQLLVEDSDGAREGNESESEEGEEQ